MLPSVVFKKSKKCKNKRILNEIFSMHMVECNGLKLHLWGFPSGLVVKNLTDNAEDMDLISGLGKSHMLQSN